MTLHEIVNQLDSCGYTCEAGPLSHNVAFIELNSLASQPAERPDTAALAEFLQATLDRIKSGELSPRDAGALISSILPSGAANSASAEILAELEERRYADAELAGTNSCVDDSRKAQLFVKHRSIAADIQRKYIRT